MISTPLFLTIAHKEVSKAEQSVFLAYSAKFIIA